jgi:hypothetical protein
MSSDTSSPSPEMQATIDNPETAYARVERYGATSLAELIVADVAVRSVDLTDAYQRVYAEDLARRINERLTERMEEASKSGKDSMLPIPPWSVDW